MTCRILHDRDPGNDDTTALAVAGRRDVPATAGATDPLARER